MVDDSRVKTNPGIILVKQLLKLNVYSLFWFKLFWFKDVNSAPKEFSQETDISEVTDNPVKNKMLLRNKCLKRNILLIKKIS